MSWGSKLKNGEAAFETEVLFSLLRSAKMVRCLSDRLDACAASYDVHRCSLLAVVCCVVVVAAWPFENAVENEEIR